MGLLQNERFATGPFLCTAPQRLPCQRGGVPPLSIRTKLVFNRYFPDPPGIDAGRKKAPLSKGAGTAGEPPVAFAVTEGSQQALLESTNPCGKGKAF